ASLRDARRFRDTNRGLKPTATIMPSLCDDETNPMPTVDFGLHSELAMRASHFTSLVTHHLLPSNLAELFAADNRLNGGADVVVVRLELGAHLRNQRAVRTAHDAAQ